MCWQNYSSLSLIGECKWKIQERAMRKVYEKFSPIKREIHKNIRA